MNPATDPSFIETQFPVSKLSKESYKERMGNSSQTLTGLGKWWGRKPLILVRAAILWLLMPAGADPRRDREVFLRLLTMDPEGLWRRKSRPIPLAEIDARLTAEEGERWFAPGAGRPRLRPGTTAAEREALQRLVFERMGYDERLTYCDRPEHLAGPSETAWAAINAHLRTDAASLPDLVRQLGERRFGHRPRVGDAFCGGGSVPFEAARIGCDAYGSDLNPVAALLTWGALNLVGGGEAVAAQVRESQARVFNAVDRQVTDWRIEHNAQGWRADAYLYCTETRCPECGWRVPLAPSWVIGDKTRTCARLHPDPESLAFRIEVRQGVSTAELDPARSGTVRDSRLLCPHCGESSSMAAIRGDRRGADGAGNALRPWENADLVPRPDDTFQERLYCIRWRLPDLGALLRTEQDARAGRPGARPVPDWVPLEGAIAALADLLDPSDRLDLAELRARDWHAEDAAAETAAADLARRITAKAPAAELAGLRAALKALREVQSQRAADLKALSDRLPGALYRGVDADDLEREGHVLALLRERFDEWQAQGYLPSRRIVSGDKTDELLRTRGWTHWHHLFTPRQLLVQGQILATALRSGPGSPTVTGALLLGLGRCADWNSRLCRGGPTRGTKRWSRPSPIRPSIRWPTSHHGHCRRSGTASFSMSGPIPCPAAPRSSPMTCGPWPRTAPSGSPTLRTRMQSITTSCRNFSSPGMKGTCPRCRRIGIRTVNAHWRFVARPGPSARAWWTPTGTSPRTCPTTACRSSCSPTRTPPSGRTWP